MSKKNEAKKNETTNVAAQTEAQATTTTKRPKTDSFQSSVEKNVNNGRVLHRTDAIHAVLLKAYSEGRLLKTSEIVAQARELLGAQHEAYEKLDRTIGAHLTTLQGANSRIGRESVIERVNGAWRLNEFGAKLVGAKLAKKETRRRNAKK